MTWHDDWGDEGAWEIDCGCVGTNYGGYYTDQYGVSMGSVSGSYDGGSSIMVYDVKMTDDPDLKISKSQLILPHENGKMTFNIQNVTPIGGGWYDLLDEGTQVVLIFNTGRRTVSQAYIIPAIPVGINS